VCVVDGSDRDGVAGSGRSLGVLTVFVCASAADRRRVRDLRSPWTARWTGFGTGYFCRWRALYIYISVQEVQDYYYYYYY